MEPNNCVGCALVVFRYYNTVMFIKRPVATAITLVQLCI